MRKNQQHYNQKLETRNVRIPKEMSLLGDDLSKRTEMDLQAPLQDINNPPNGLPKPGCVHEKSMSNAAEEIPSIRNSQALDCAAWLKFDEHGMVLPHSILGSLEDFRSYLEAIGEKNLVKQIPTSSKDFLSKATKNRPTNSVERKVPSHQRNIQMDIQRNALQQWDKHVTNWRHQQDELKRVLHRPVENLLMNQGNHFRETQEQKKILNRVMPLTHSGYGYRVGSEFWSLPQSYGDEMSCITATLTQTERGQRKPVTHVGQPSSIQKELGIISAETPASHSWSQSSYCRQLHQELGDVLQEMDIKKPEFSKLEVIGSGKLFSSSTECQSSFEEKEEEKEERKEVTMKKIDREVDDVQLKAVPIPALRICGQTASWTGNSISNKGRVGISTPIFFEALTGEIASSNLELHNDGSTAIFYSWQKLTASQSFSHLQSQKKRVPFCFNFSSGVICPGDTQQIKFIFKSDDPGLKTELWQLNTHPVLLEGASIQVRLSGVALNQDKTADQRLFLENKLEKTVVVKTCRSIVCEMLQRVSTPERPCSPAELYITEEQQFLNKNPKLQYFYQPVEELKNLWKKVNPGVTWDFSVDSLRQAVLSLPNDEPSSVSSTKEESLVQLNALFLQLSESTHLKHHLTAAFVGQQLWKKLLDSMSAEATRLINVFGLPEEEMRFDKKHHDADVPDHFHKDDELEYEGTASKEERSERRSKFKEGSNVGSESSTMEHLLGENKKKGGRKDDAGKHQKEGSSPSTLSDVSSETSIQPKDQSVDSELRHIYTKTLHKKVCALMGDLVEDLFDLMEEMHVVDGQTINTVDAGHTLLLDQ